MSKNIQGKDWSFTSIKEMLTKKYSSLNCDQFILNGSKYIVIYHTGYTTPKFLGTKQNKTLSKQQT